MPSEIYKKPRYFFNVSLPLVRNEHIKRPIFVSRFGLGYFGPSGAPVAGHAARGPPGPRP